jgi:SAM-dependent methyltransferase
MKMVPPLVIYKGNKVPLFQSKLYQHYSEAVSCPMIDVIIAQERETGLIKNIGYDYSNIDYGQDYNNDQTTSLVFKRHLLFISKTITEIMPKSDYLEIGCGKGGFLDLLESEGCRVFGFDPSYTGDKSNIIKAYYRGESMFKTPNVIMRHVLEHISDPLIFIQTVKKSCGGGFIYIEVPSLEWIIENNAWYDFTGEHCNYFTIDFFRSIFSDIVFLEKTFGGQYISLIARIDSFNYPLSVQKEVAVPNSFGPQKSFDSYFGEDNYVWGAAGKGVIFCNYAVGSGLKIKKLFDININKTGRLIPGTGQPICNPKEIKIEKGGNIFVMNRMYLEEVKDFCGPDFNYISV